MLSDDTYPRECDRFLVEKLAEMLKRQFCILVINNADVTIGLLSLRCLIYAALYAYLNVNDVWLRRGFVTETP